MEDVLNVYTLPRDPQKPLICMDESSKQQVKEVRSPILMKAAQPERFDNEYGLRRRPTEATRFNP